MAIMCPVVRTQKAQAVSCGKTRLQHPSYFKGIFYYSSAINFAFLPQSNPVCNLTLLGEAPFNRLLCKTSHILFFFSRIINASATNSGPQKLFISNPRTGFLIVNGSLNEEM